MRLRNRVCPYCDKGYFCSCATEDDGVPRCQGCDWHLECRPDDAVEDAPVYGDQEDLLRGEGKRVAKCGCGKVVESRPDLAFFQRIPDEEAVRRCRHCGFYTEAHPRKLCPNGFAPRGPFDYDIFYCGHGGWD